MKHQSDQTYVDIGKLNSVPQIIEVSDGYSYKDNTIEYIT